MLNIECMHNCHLITGLSTLCMKLAIAWENGLLWGMRTLLCMPKYSSSVTRFIHIFLLFEQNEMRKKVQHHNCWISSFKRNTREQWNFHFENWIFYGVKSKSNRAMYLNILAIWQFSPYQNYLLEILKSTSEYFTTTKSIFISISGTVRHFET